MEKEENQNSNSDNIEEIKGNEDPDKSTKKKEDLKPEDKIKELEDKDAAGWGEFY